MVEVILEIQEPDPSPVASSGSRQEIMAARKQRFLNACAPVERRIQKMGGEVLDHAWLNQTLRVRVPARIVEQLSEPECVTLVDTPARLARE